MLGHNTPAVFHHVLARIEPNKLICLRKTACQPTADTVFPPLAGKFRASQRLGNSASRRLASGFPQTNQLVGVYSG